jgi:anti-anti-sigma factor
LYFASIVLLTLKFVKYNYSTKDIEDATIFAGAEFLDGYLPTFRCHYHPRYRSAPRRRRGTPSSIGKHVSAGRYAHLIDLRSLAELDSRSLAALIRALRVARDVGGSVGLITDQPQFARILSITGLDRVFPVYKNEAEATAALTQRDVVPA